MHPKILQMLIWLVLAFSRKRYVSANQMSTPQLTDIFSKIFKTYDKRILPSPNGDPVNVSMQLYFLDMMPLKRYHMHYHLHLFVRQIWTDYRLNISVQGSDWNAFGVETLRDIWTPEVHFPSAKKGKWYTLLKPNTGLHIRKDGIIFLSRRIALTVYCPMDLRNFPFDEQTCKMDMRFYAFNNEHCRLKWDYRKGGPIYQLKELSIPEFNLKSISHAHEIFDNAAAGKFDTLSVTLKLKRKRVHYLVNYMLPCAMIVVLSWVGFWIDHRSTPARASLGITTVLTITTLTNSIRSSLPHVAYIKSIDVYLLACFVFVFASTIEFAIAGVTDRKWLKSFKKQQKKAKENKKQKRQKIEIQETSFQSKYCEVSTAEVSRADEIVIERDVTQLSVDVASIAYVDEPKTGAVHKRKGKFKMANNEKGTESSQVTDEHGWYLRRRWRAVVEKVVAKHHKERDNVHVIDKISRILFPVLFIIFNSLYIAVVFFWHESKERDN